MSAKKIELSDEFVVDQAEENGVAQEAEQAVAKERQPSKSGKK